MEKINITALGDSLTKGVVLNSENRYSILKGSFIDIISDKLNLCIKNYAKFGCTIGFGHSVIDRHSSDISASDITFLEFGGNDCDFDWKMIAENPTSEHTPKTILESFKKQFLLLVDRVRALGSKPMILSLPPIDSDISNKVLLYISCQRVMMFISPPSHSTTLAFCSSFIKRLIKEK